MNVGYGTGIDGSIKSYLLRWYRYLYTPRWVIRQVRQSIYALLNREQPDLCCFVEIHQKNPVFPLGECLCVHVVIIAQLLNFVNYLISASSVHVP